MSEAHVTQISQILESSKIERFGITPLKTPITIDIYKDWLNCNFHGDMDFLKEHLPQKQEPSLLLPRAQTAIVIAQDYLPHPKQDNTFTNSRVALYAKGQDYHLWFQEKLQKICQKLEASFPKENFVSFTDSSPVLERDLAYRAGLGWIGKNTCLIDEKHGSLFFIGEIYTTMAMETAEVLAPDRCGTCTRCIDACPTEALIEPKKLDATRCISYLTIESKSLPDKALRPKIGDWLFGCDICQTVCPWNKKAFGKKLTPQIPKKEDIVSELREILQSSSKALARKLKDLPLSRARGWRLKRNAIVVATNQGFKELSPDILALKNDPHLSELVTWALEALDSKAI